MALVPADSVRSKVTPLEVDEEGVGGEVELTLKTDPVVKEALDKAKVLPLVLAGLKVKAELPVILESVVK